MAGYRLMVDRRTEDSVEGWVKSKVENSVEGRVEG